MNVSPTSERVDPAGIEAFLDAVESDPLIEPHGLIIQRHSHRIAEGYWAPHDRGRGRLVYSLSKSFTGAALGLQICEGRLELDDLVGDHLPEFELHDDAKRLRIRHIASMATGHTDETLGDALAADPSHAVRGFLSLSAPHEPGTVFAYNQPPVLTLAMILERLAGERLSEYLKPRLLDPLGIRTFAWSSWPLQIDRPQVDRAQVDMGFSGVFTDLNAIAKLGQLHLDGGTLDGDNLLPSTWIAEASRTQTENPGGETVDWQQGYGFQLWQSQHGYRGDGAFGQFMVVLPEHDAVVAMFANTDHMQLVLDAMWEHLLPAFDRPGAPGGDDQLAARLDRLALPAAAQRFSTTRLGSLPVEERFTPAPATATTHTTIWSVEIRAGRLLVHEDDPATTGATLDLPLTEVWTTEGNIATSAARHVDGTLTVDVAFLNTPHRLELTMTDGEFISDWGRVPLFGAGISNKLHEIAVAPA